MTIAQQFLGKKTCKQQEEPLVPTEKSSNLKDAEEGRPVVVTMHAHVRRVNSLTTVCVFATVLLVLTTGIIGGMYLYRQFAHYKLRHFRGWCSIPYLPDTQDEPKAEQMMLNHASSIIATEAWDTDSPKANFFEEEFDIDIKFEQYERIEVPEFANGRRGQFVHDFVVNRTAIVDYENRRCFVMILNRNYVLPPRVLYEQVSKMRSGYYDADTQTVRHFMQVITPPIGDIKNLGFYIARDCSSVPIYMLEKTRSPPIYMLEKAHSPVYKRSIAEKKKKDMFVEFAGIKVNEYKIINIDEAVPGEKPVESS